MRKEFQQFLQRVFGNLKMTEKAKDGTLTAEDWMKVNENFKEVTGNLDMYQMLAKVQEEESQAQSNADRAKQHDDALAILTAVAETTNGGEGTDNGGGEGTQQAQGLGEVATALVGRVNRLENENRTMRAALGQLPQDVQETVTINVARLGIVPAHSESHLFGVNHVMYDRSRRWNQVFINPGIAVTFGAPERAVEDAFATDFSTFGNQVANAMRGLHAAGQLNPEVLRSATNPDLTALTNAGLGDQFVQFRVREIIARVLSVPNPFGIFPMRSGIQDRDIMTNAFVGELTQAFQDNEAALKGSSTFDPELGYVDDAMILSKFGSFKDMERKYIAYLNTNGSDPVKYGMIEWLMMLYMMQAVKELYIRVIRGIYMKPVDGTAGHYLNASTGIVNRIFFYHIEKKLRGLEDATMNTYDNTGTVFIDMLIELGQWLIDNLAPLGINLDNGEVAIYANANHRSWFRRGYRSKYALQTDFKGTEDTVIPDTQIPIIWVPNMGDLKVVWATQPGNMQVLENIPGEMFKFYMERRLNNVFVTSNWKEGSAAAYAGRKAADKATLDARAWDQQAIWFAKPYTALLADATTADAANGFWFKTIANTGATAITTISNKVAGQVYFIECGSATNATTIAKSGDFSAITAAYTPTAVGDILVVVWDAGASKFKEICRVVGGTLAYNSATTPNAIGAR
jgi:hypothetical protein